MKIKKINKALETEQKSAKICESCGVHCWGSASSAFNISKNIKQDVSWISTLIFLCI